MYLIRTIHTFKSKQSCCLEVKVGVLVTALTDTGVNITIVSEETYSIPKLKFLEWRSVASLNCRPESSTYI